MPLFSCPCYEVEVNKGLKYKAFRGCFWKSKGLLSQMLSLPENWDYTLAGLSHINKESIDAIRTAVLELEKTGYIERSQGRDEKGKMTAITYTIYEQPQSPVLENPTSDKPVLENPTTDKPTSDNPMQLNKDIQKTDPSKKEKINKRGTYQGQYRVWTPHKRKTPWPWSHRWNPWPYSWNRMQQKKAHLNCRWWIPGGACKGKIYEAWQQPYRVCPWLYAGKYHKGKKHKAVPKGSAF